MKESIEIQQKFFFYSIEIWIKIRMLVVVKYGALFWNQNLLIKIIFMNKFAKYIEWKRYIF